ncbi:hypothetical protein RIF29_17480 [Crotalaria pallida]|uniref:Uncharacterized protein n=1 Tax=Crotalaria pallida TaxID=3830 RepID=A0AAN9IKE7_CROPI
MGRCGPSRSYFASLVWTRSSTTHHNLEPSTDRYKHKFAYEMAYHGLAAMCSGGLKRSWLKLNVDDDSLTHGKKSAPVMDFYETKLGSLICKRLQLQ